MFLKTSFVALLLCYSVTPSVTEDLKLSLYYVSLCPFSIEFIQEQLQPVYAELGSDFTVDLIPYGRTNHTKTHGKWETTCRHGPEECYADRVQSCVLGRNTTQEASLNFVFCVMISGNPENEKDIKKCAKQNKLSWTDIKTCVNGNEGDELVSHFQDRTNSLDPKLQYVPHILFNDVFNRTEELSARDDLRKLVCEKLDYKPKGCSTNL